ncbi:glucosaminidase domain-containing protein [Patescibacteria group bacterium]
MNPKSDSEPLPLLGIDPEKKEKSEKESRRLQVKKASTYRLLRRSEEQAKNLQDSDKSSEEEKKQDKKTDKIEDKLEDLEDMDGFGKMLAEIFKFIKSLSDSFKDLNEVGSNSDSSKKETEDNKNKGSSDSDSGSDTPTSFDSNEQLNPDKDTLFEYPHESKGSYTTSQGTYEINGDSPPQRKLREMPDHVAAFTEKFLPYAIDIRLKYGVPIAVTMSIAALESGYGRSKASSYNIFGIMSGDKIKKYDDPFASIEAFAQLIAGVDENGQPRRNKRGKYKNRYRGRLDPKGPYGKDIDHEGLWDNYYQEHGVAIAPNYEGCWENKYAYRDWLYVTGWSGYNREYDEIPQDKNISEYADPNKVQDIKTYPEKVIGLAERWEFWIFDHELDQLGKNQTISNYSNYLSGVHLS